MVDFKKSVAKAVHHFWSVRESQQKNQGSANGKKDYGSRGAVTGGKHLDGFISLLSELVADAGLPDSTIHKRSTTLPGYFRPTKSWDLVVVVDGRLLASIEFKAQVGSFGNNFNNRVEEALGNSTDLLTAYREGKFKPSQKPWMGWLMRKCGSKMTGDTKISDAYLESKETFSSKSYMAPDSAMP